MPPKLTQTNLGIFSPADTSMLLTTFITELDQKLETQQLNIVNGPACLKSMAALKKAQAALGLLITKTKDYGLVWGTTSELRHVKESAEEGLRELTIEEIRTYYNQVAELTIEKKIGTCEGLCAAALKLAIPMLKDQAINNIGIEICVLRNY